MKLLIRLVIGSDKLAAILNPKIIETNNKQIEKSTKIIENDICNPKVFSSEALYADIAFAVSKR